MLLSVIPLTAFAKYNNEYYAAANTNYISQVAMYNSSSSNDDAKNNLRNKGWTPIGANFNSGDAHDSNFVHMGAKYSTNAAEAIRAFRIYKGQGAPNSITSWINGYNVTFYKVGSGAHDCVPSVLSGSVDLNAGGGGDYLYIYATRDPNAGPPVTAYTMTVDSDQYLSGWYHVTSFHDTGTPYDANSGQGSKSAFLWCHWKSSATGVSTTNLRTAYTNSASYETSTNYTEASRAVLKTARTNASTCYTAFDNNGGVAAYTQTQINAYQTAITTALNNLQTNVYLKATTNGGTPDKDTTVTIGTKSSVEFDVSEYAATKNYYNFVGWNTDKDATTGSASSVTVGMNTPVYAIFSAELKDTFCYLTSDGENTSEEKTVTVYNNTDSAEVTAPVEIGSFVTYGGKTYTLVGWRSDTAAAAPMNASNTYTHSVATPEATHYAVYRNDITVEYNKNGGETDMPSETKPQYLTASSEMNISNPSFTLAADPTRVGHTFAGWYTDSECSDENKAGDAGETYTANENTTLYAKWNINSYTVIFANYDGEAVKTESVKYGEKATAPAENPAKPYDETYHYVFSGWNGFTDETVVTEDVTYTAKYDAVEHTYSEFVEQVKAATCTEQGEEKYKCANCDSTTIKAIPVAADAHAWGEWTVTTAPTCTALGVETRVCTRDANHAETRDLAKESHVLTHHDAKAATCTAVGWNAYDKCANCDYTTYVEIPVDVNAHAWGEWTVTDATCKQAGSRTRVCNNNNEHTETENIPVKEHTPVTVPGKESTCTETGLTDGKKCSVCNEVLVEQEVIPEKPHTPGEAVKENETSATCTAEGSYDEVVYCTVCKNEISRDKKKTVTIPHTIGILTEKIAEATCTAEGREKTVTICKVCKTVFSTETKTIAKTAHTPGEAVKENEAAATCTAEGSYDEVVYCSVCTAELSREPKTEEKIAHDFELVSETAATCTADGEKSYKCTRCDETKTEKLTANGHSWGEWVTVKEPTATEEGLAKRTCSACGTEEEKTLDRVSERNRIIQFVNIDRMHYVLDNDGEDYIVYNSGAVKWYTDKPLNFTVYTYSNFKYQTVIVKVDGVEISPNADGVYTVPAGENLAVVTVVGAVEDSDGTKLSFWEMIVRFFKKIFSAIAGLFGGSSGSKS